MRPTEAKDPNRQTGRTTRLLWRALLIASEGQDDVAVVVRGDWRVADWTFERLRQLTDPLFGCAFSKARRSLVLPGEGKSVIVVPEGDRERRLTGWNGQVVEDHP